MNQNGKDGADTQGVSLKAPSWFNDFALGPFISGVVQGFASVGMQRRTEKKEATRKAAASKSEEGGDGASD